MKKISFGGVILALILLMGCLNDIEKDDSMLDGDLISDATVDSVKRKEYVVSAQDSAELSKPVILAAHGFTASTFEWREFWEHARDVRGDSVKVSLVLLGGHGTNIKDFEKSTWEDWGRPLIDEYDTLVSLGYTNISFVTASTGGTLLLNHIAEGAFKNRIAPKQVLFVDPLVVAGDSRLTVVYLAGPILGNLPNNLNDNEKEYWYTNRPAKVFNELNEIASKVRHSLQDGFSLPKGTQGKVWKSKVDGTAAPIGGLLIHKGVRDENGKKIELEYVDSRKHVFTRLRARGASAKDSVLQKRVFNEIIDRVLTN